MKTTIEMSLYPLTEQYTGVIIDLIKNLKSHDTIEVKTTAMSTYLTGEFRDIMSVLTIELEKVYKIIPDSATVIKIIPKPLNVRDGFLEF